MDDLQQFIGGLDQKYGPVIRTITVIDAKDSPTGSKKPIGEDNSMTQEEIKANRCSLKPGQTANTYSIALKHMPNIFVVDFDFKENVEDNELFQKLKSDQSFMTETDKGYHFYTSIIDVPPFSNEVKIGHPDYFGDQQNQPIDLLGGKKNVWEKHGRPLVGEHISEYDWGDISKYFNLDKMNIQGQVVVQGMALELVEDPQDEPQDQPADFAGLDQDCPTCSKEEFMEYLGRLNMKRCDGFTDWVKVSIIIHNNFIDDPESYTIFKDWSVQSDRFNEANNKKIWMGFKKKKVAKPLTYKTLMNMAEQDDPSNHLRTLYDKHGERAMVEHMNETICYKRDGRGEYIWIPEPNSLKLQIKKAGDIGEDHKNLCWVYKEGEKYKERDPSKVYRSSKWKKQVDRIDFDPSPNAPKNIFNLWRGYFITKENAVASDAADALLEHIKASWCDNNDVYFEYTLNWLAWILQFPEKKIGVMMSLASCQGTGKGIVLDTLAYIMDGEKEEGYYGQYGSMESITGSYSYALEGKILINLDEAFWGGDKKLEGQMKNLITEKKQEIKKKFCAPYFIKNTTAFIGTSNNYRYVGITEDDRRNYCLRVIDVMEGKTRTEKADYFCNISKRLNNGEVCPEVASAFAHHLYNRDLSNFRPADFPRTKESQEQMIQGWNSTKRFWYEIINEGSFGKWKSLDEATPTIDKYSKMCPEKGMTKDGDMYVYKRWI